MRQRGVCHSDGRSGVRAAAVWGSSGTRLLPACGAPSGHVTPAAATKRRSWGRGGSSLARFPAPWPQGGWPDGAGGVCSSRLKRRGEGRAFSGSSREENGKQVKQTPQSATAETLGRGTTAMSASSTDPSGRPALLRALRGCVPAKRSRSGRRGRRLGPLREPAEGHGGEPHARLILPVTFVDSWPCPDAHPVLCSLSLGCSALSYPGRPAQVP